MPFSGPAELLAMAARTVLGDEQAATDYLERLRRSGEWIDQQTERLRIGAGKGRLPVAPLVHQAIDWAESVLRPAVPAALAAPGSTGWLGPRRGLARGAGRTGWRGGEAGIGTLGRGAARVAACGTLG